LRRGGHLAAFDAAASRLPVARDLARLVGEDAALEQPFDEVDLVADRVVAPDLHLHRLGRAAAVERDHRVPARLI
jgi:hypothetical protein